MKPTYCLCTQHTATSANDTLPEHATIQHATIPIQQTLDDTLPEHASRAVQLAAAATNTAEPEHATTQQTLDDTLNLRARI